MCTPYSYSLDRRDRYHALSQPYNFGPETHFGGGDVNASVFLSATILSVKTDRQTDRQSGSLEDSRSLVSRPQSPFRVFCGPRTCAHMHSKG